MCAAHNGFARAAVGPDVRYAKMAAMVEGACIAVVECGC